MSLYARIAEEKLRTMLGKHIKAQESSWDNIYEILWNPRSGKAVLVFEDGSKKTIYNVYEVKVVDTSDMAPITFYYDESRKATCITKVSEYDGSNMKFSAEYDRGTLYIG